MNIAALSFCCAFMPLCFCWLWAFMALPMHFIDYGAADIPYLLRHHFLTRHKRYASWNEDNRAWLNWKRLSCSRAKLPRAKCSRKYWPPKSWLTRHKCVGSGMWSLKRIMIDCHRLQISLPLVRQRKHAWNCLNGFSVTQNHHLSKLLSFFSSVYTFLYILLYILLFVLLLFEIHKSKRSTDLPAGAVRGPDPFSFCFAKRFWLTWVQVLSLTNIRPGIIASPSFVNLLIQILFCF